MGQEYAAQALMAQLGERSVLVELHYAHNPLTRRRAAMEAAAMARDLDKAEIAGSGGLSVTDQDRVPGVQSVVSNTSANANATKVEDMGPLRIFEHYMSQLEVTGLSIPDTATTNITTDGPSEILPTGDLAAVLHERVLKEGRDTIDRLLGTAGATSVTAARRVKDLVLDRVTLSNFGPYGGERAVEYPLSKRGLVLIRGRSTDGTGADSNGAGKVCGISVMFSWW